MKVLVAIPCITDAVDVTNAIDSFTRPDVEFLLIDNGATDEVKAAIQGRGNVISNKVNLYVNPAWNQAMLAFLDGYWDVLIIANSDIVVYKGWFEALERGLSEPATVCSPSLIPMGHNVDSGAATAGVCMCLPRAAVREAYPIPLAIRVWFGDAWIFRMLISKGWKVLVLKDMIFSHHNSKPSHSIPGIPLIIEQDKVAWSLLNKPWDN